MEDSTSDSLKSLLNRSPFVLSNQDIRLTDEIISKIKIESNSFNKPLNNFAFSGKNYDIDFIDQGETVIIKFNQKSKCILQLNNIENKPFEVTFEDIDEVEIKKLSIFRINVYNKMLYYLSTKVNEYCFIENKENKTLIIKRKIFQIPDEIITEAKNNKFNSISNLIAENFKINPLLLSSNFYHIFNDIKEGKDFYLIMNQERNDFYQKLLIL